MKLTRLALAIALGVAAGPALAKDLPGVQQPETIVQPLPEPQDSAPDNCNGFVKVGDWDVKVSGSVTIDVGVGALARPPKR